MQIDQIRDTFIRFFEAKGHTVVPSSALIPAQDPTLLFTNAGMVQFKDVFLGQVQKPYKRAVSVQRCVRAGGKHNDLDEVGYTSRHHTFFEMLGNFSFGDYFKREAIQMAWELLTNHFKLPQEKLWVTVYEEDLEAETIWLKEQGIAPNRFSRCGAKDNFWAMGDMGPCGPCSEIYFDHGPEFEGGPPGSGQEGDRYVEIWNLVFMQYDRMADGRLVPLPKPSVDTGMGLERIAAVLQGVHSNYDIDLFEGLWQAIRSHLPALSREGHTWKVIADHLRSAAFLVLDGVLPSNEGRGYVLRRIIRRALRHAHQQKVKEPFFFKLVQALVKQMGVAYPALRLEQRRLEQTLLEEEQQFSKTVEQGLKWFESGLSDQEALSGEPVVSGALVFKLYDTYGFPSDLTADMARERGWSIDWEGFHEAMAEQKARARAAGQFVRAETLDVAAFPKTRFIGHERLESTSTVLGVLEGRWVVLDETPFYPESGGQVGDKGRLVNHEGEEWLIEDTQRVGEVIVHALVPQSGGEIQVGTLISTVVASEGRRATARHHSATHLLHAALRETLGSQLVQRGSLVDANRLRFDFAHGEPLERALLNRIEQRVNEEIQQNSAVKVECMSLESAKKTGALALFGEKYEEEVRVLTMGRNRFSVELCGGTHVESTGDIGYFRIVGESAQGAGVRRIEAVAGMAAVGNAQLQLDVLQQLTQILQAPVEELTLKVQEWLKKTRHLEKELLGQRQQALFALSDRWLEEARPVGAAVLLAQVVPPEVDANSVRAILDRLRQKEPRLVALLATLQSHHIQLWIGLGTVAQSFGSVQEWLIPIGALIVGKGGGRPDFGQAGGKNPAAWPTVVAWVEQQLGS